VKYYVLNETKERKEKKYPLILITSDLSCLAYPHPSQLPNRLNSNSVQSRPSFLSESRETPFPLSIRPVPVTDEPLGDRALPERAEPEDGTLVCAALPDATDDGFLLGSARRYQPPVYVSAIS